MPKARNAMLVGINSVLKISTNDFEAPVVKGQWMEAVAHKPLWPCSQALHMIRSQPQLCNKLTQINSILHPLSFDSINLCGSINLKTETMRKSLVNQDKKYFFPESNHYFRSSKLQKKWETHLSKSSFLWNALEKAISKKGIFCNTWHHIKQGESEWLSASGPHGRWRNFPLIPLVTSTLPTFSDQGSVMLLSLIMDLRK